MPATVPGLSLAWDDNTQAAIKNISGFKARLGQNMRIQMTQNKTFLVFAATDNMAWQNPSGALHDSFFSDSRVVGNYTAIVGSTLPYAARREFGFDGADSLGRVYHDPGAFYLTRAFGTEAPNIQARIQRAIADTWNSVTYGYGAPVVV